MAKFSLTSNRVTLVLCLLVVFTLLHSLLVGALQTAVQRKLSYWKDGPQNLAAFSRPLRNPMDNAAPYYRAAWELCMRGPQTAPLETLVQDGKVLAAVRANPQVAQEVVTTFQPALELLERAYDRKECSYDIRYTLGMSAPAPNFLAIRTLCRAAAVKTALEHSRQDWAAMSTTAQHTLRFLRTLEPDHTLIGVMIRVACLSQLADALQGAPKDQLSRAFLLELQLTHDGLDAQFQRALAGERLMAVQLYDQLLAGSATLRGTLQSKDGDGEGLQGIVYRLGGQPLLLIDELAYLNVRQKQELDLNADVSPGPFAVATMLTFRAGKAQQRVQELRARLGTLL